MDPYSSNYGGSYGQKDDNYSQHYDQSQAYPTNQIYTGQQQAVVGEYPEPVAQDAIHEKNFPPLPKRFPLKPCFYQDISNEIPVELQDLMRKIYYLWAAYAIGLGVNIIGALTYLIASSANDVRNSSGSTFGSSIITALMFIPASYVLWFRAIYNAFKSDSSFYYFIFFFVFFFQTCTTAVQALGFDGWSTVGIISGSFMLSTGIGGAIFAGLIMLIIGIGFALIAAADVFVLLKIHGLFRNTGATFAKAQQEFSSGIMSNKNVQQAAGGVVTNAAFR